MMHRTKTLTILAAALALTGAFTVGRLTAPVAEAPGPKWLAPTPDVGAVLPEPEVQLAHDRRALVADVERPGGPDLSAGAVEGPAVTEAEEELGALAQRYPLLVGLVEFDDVPFAEVDLDELRGLEFMHLLRSVRAAAATEEAAAIAAIPEPLRRTVSRSVAESEIANGPEVYFAKLPTTKAAAFGSATYVELTEDLTPVLRQLRDLSVEVHTHPAYETYKLGWAGHCEETRTPLPIVEWRAEKWGARLVGYDAAGTVLATSDSKWLGMP
ncbi:hypothetical protein Pla163_35930 [Planctomycetes bacterium Pla163]|uniref:Secreted protein n=1 Tax=Rohdeia mirabilis TaxID=2528008 RepID=A0A518D4P2_9BACT|nr:hypothetical protein Pla163_35930 [Planctomycetes bacterium Pla163]